MEVIGIIVLIVVVLYAMGSHDEKETARKREAAIEEGMRMREPRESGRACPVEGCGFQLEEYVLEVYRGIMNCLESHTLRGTAVFLCRCSNHGLFRKCGGGRGSRNAGPNAFGPPTCQNLLRPNWRNGAPEEFPARPWPPEDWDDLSSIRSELGYSTKPEFNIGWFTGTSSAIKNKDVRCDDCGPIHQYLEDRSRTKPSRVKIPATLRAEVLHRDNFTCQWDGKNRQNTPGLVLHVDHVVPVSKGGKTELSNLQVLCADCNIGKGNTYSV